MIFVSIFNMSHCGSEGSLLTTLFGIHCYAIKNVCCVCVQIIVSKVKLSFGEPGSQLNHSSMILLSVLKMSKSKNRTIISQSLIQERVFFSALLILPCSHCQKVKQALCIDLFHLMQYIYFFKIA